MLALLVLLLLRVVSPELLSLQSLSWPLGNGRVEGLRRHLSMDTDTKPGSPTSTARRVLPEL